ncbi:MAG: DUF4156 domain-containing protein [Gammaproteobacteria bacterium]|nr:DUF4156 domain-containing protein [Gammaproteobacteria bacterium]
MYKIVPLLLLAFTIQACTWVKLTPEAEKVRVLSATEVESCKTVGKTTVSLKADIAGIDRNQEKVKKELETLGRNHAADMGGDTIVPASEIKDGKQSFDVYRCIN